jgi:hypothetical protein
MLETLGLPNPGGTNEGSWAQLGDTNAPRGVMFWNANLDQQHVMNGTLDPGYTLAGGFNSFLHVRDSDEAVGHPAWKDTWTLY